MPHSVGGGDAHPTIVAPPKQTVKCVTLRVIPAKAGIRKLSTSRVHWMPAARPDVNTTCASVPATRTRRPGFALAASAYEGDGTPKSANPVARAFRHAGASRRAMSGDLANTGPRFSPSVPASPSCLKAKRGSRLDRPDGRQPAPGRAPYWVRAVPRHRPSAWLRTRPAGRRTSSRLPRRFARNVPRRMR